MADEGLISFDELRHKLDALEAAQERPVEELVIEACGLRKHEIQAPEP